MKKVNRTITFYSNHSDREIDSHLLCGNHHFIFGGKEYYSVHSLIEEYSGAYWD